MSPSSAGKSFEKVIDTEATMCKLLPLVHSSFFCDFFKNKFYIQGTFSSLLLMLYHKYKIMEFYMDFMRKITPSIRYIHELKSQPFTMFWMGSISIETENTVKIKYIGKCVSWQLVTKKTGLWLMECPFYLWGMILYITRIIVTQENKVFFILKAH